MPPSASDDTPNNQSNQNNRNSNRHQGRGRGRDHRAPSRPTNGLTARVAAAIVSATAHAEVRYAKKNDQNRVHKPQHQNRRGHLSRKERRAFRDAHATDTVPPPAPPVTPQSQSATEKPNLERYARDTPRTVVYSKVDRSTGPPVSPELFPPSTIQISQLSDQDKDNLLRELLDKRSATETDLLLRQLLNQQAGPLNRAVSPSLEEVPSSPTFSPTDQDGDHDLLGGAKA